MLQKPLKSFDCPLMRISLTDSVLVTFIFSTGRVMGDNEMIPGAVHKSPRIYLLYCIEVVVIAAQCTATFLRSILLPRI